MRGRPSTEHLSQCCLSAAEFFKKDGRTMIAIRLRQASRRLLCLSREVVRERSRKEFLLAVESNQKSNEP